MCHSVPQIKPFLLLQPTESSALSSSTSARHAESHYGVTSSIMNDLGSSSKSRLHHCLLSSAPRWPRPHLSPPPGLVSSMWLSGITTCTSIGIGPRCESAPESLASASEAPQISPVATLSASPSDPDCKLALLISGVSCQLGAMESFSPFLHFEASSVTFLCSCMFPRTFSSVANAPAYTFYTFYTIMTVLKHFVYFLFCVCIGPNSRCV